MNMNRSPHSNTHLSISLHNYVAHVQQQMKQTDRELISSVQQFDQQTKQEQFISRHLVKTLV